MPLSRYGVAVGTFHEFRRDPTHDFGHWYHGHLSLDTTAGLFESALDVDAPSSVGVSYRLVDDLMVADIPTLQGLTAGFHPLDSTPASGALDYARSPLLRDSSWFDKARETSRRIEQTVRRPSTGAPVFHPTAGDVVAKWLTSLRRRMAHRLPSTAPCRPGPRIFPWVSSNGDNALDVLVPHLAGAARIYVFGQKVATKNIVHDVHCNQGDPPGTQWYPENGIWQDGAVMCQGTDGRVVVWQIKFNTQSLHTDDDGHPI
ncbi:DUF2278 family protein [Streptomyces hiroshimensis]|uniref:Uncharacterized protein n=1 Tax=Streptomyces hiroshimensis TaxID=66424 RepID=A0ABQ2Z3G4_9ACTN|nr:DUF2278 family protein [Streptomyces hiroshimensis]GGY01441.1 hypothetical protein GCM10010324_55410 [Streptomyces hiroshimensis]